MTENKLQQVDEKRLTDIALNRVRTLEAEGNLFLPANYSAENALKQAQLLLADTVDRNKCPALSVASQASILSALLDMVTQGLNPVKDQCYFIVYGNKLQLQRSVFGNILLLKRDAGAKEVITQIIYKGDTFKQKLDGTGRIESVHHEQDFFNIKNEGIVGAYCTIEFEDDRPNHIELMTMEQIKQSWLQSRMIKDEAALERSKTHNSFKEEMCKKTVINRATKRYINSSTDESLLQYAKETEIRQRKEVLDVEVEEHANKDVIDFEDAEFKEVSDFQEVQDVPEQQTEQAPEQHDVVVENEEEEPF